MRYSVMLLLLFCSSMARADPIEWDESQRGFGIYKLVLGATQDFPAGVVNGATVYDSTGTVAASLQVPLQFSCADIQVRSGTSVPYYTATITSASAISGAIHHATLALSVNIDKQEADHYVNEQNVFKNGPPYFVPVEDTGGNYGQVNLYTGLFTNYGIYKVPVIPGGFMAIRALPAAGGAEPINNTGLTVIVRFRP